MNKKPEIIISSLDLDRLYNLIESLPKSGVVGVSELEAELDRANVVSLQRFRQQS